MIIEEDQIKSEENQIQSDNRKPEVSLSKNYNNQFRRFGRQTKAVMSMTT